MQREINRVSFNEGVRLFGKMEQEWGAHID